jgi:hypothetical protein
MAVALAIFSVALGAFCIWLTVRVINHWKKPGVQRWVRHWAPAVVVASIILLATAPELAPVRRRIADCVNWLFDLPK